MVVKGLSSPIRQIPSDAPMGAGRSSRAGLEGGRPPRWGTASTEPPWPTGGRMLPGHALHGFAACAKRWADWVDPHHPATRRAEAHEIRDFRALDSPQLPWHVDCPDVMIGGDA